jgi:hypothetical protein
VSLVAVVSFLSLYIYQLPTHHCPFDMLQRGYGFVGYALYGALFAATLYGLLPGLFVASWKITDIGAEVRSAERRWLRLGLLSVIAFAIVSSWPVVFGRLRLLGR